MQQVEQMRVVFLWYWLKTFRIGQEVAGFVSLGIHGFEMMTLKRRAFLPGRVWVKKGWPELAIVSKMVMSRNIGNSMIRASRLSRKSKKGFMVDLYIILTMEHR